MPCDDIFLACEDENTVGSFRKLYVIPFDKVVAVTASTADHSITGVTLDPTGSIFYTIEGKIGSKGYNSEGVESAGRSIHDKTITMFIPGLDKTTASTLECLKECGAFAIIEDYDGKGWVAGYDDLIQRDGRLKLGVSELLETTIEGQNGYSITFTGRSIELTRQFIGTIPITGGNKIFA